MPYSLYRDAYISQLERVMDPDLKDRTSSKQIKRAGGLRDYRINKIHIYENGSHQTQQRGSTDQCTQISKLSEMRNCLCADLRRGDGDPLDETTPLISMPCSYRARKGPSVIDRA